MSFYWPHLLWLLVPIAVLAVLDAVRRGRTAATQDWPKILRVWAGARQAAVGAGHRLTRGRLLLWLGLAFGVVALARPQWGRVEEPVFDQAREIVIALDLSRSMLAPDVRPSRLERARLLIQGLLDGLRGERVGLVVFAGSAFLQVPLSADYEVLNEFLPSLNPDYMPVVGTNYEAMLHAALDAFSDGSTADRYLIILSDGESQTDDWKSLLPELRRKNIRVIALGVGTAQGAFIPDKSGGYVKDDRGAVVLSKLNSSTLRELAQTTHGVYTDASTWVDLGALLKQTVAAGRRGEFKDRVQVRLIERFQWALAPALLCLLLSLWREFPVRPRVRNLPLAGEGKSGDQQKKNPPPGVSAVLVLLLLLGGLRLAPIARAAEDTTVYAAPLSTLVEHLAEQPSLSADDYAALARETITWGQRLQESHQTPTPGPVHDALTGVDAGEKLNAQAADWPKLRRQLQALLKTPPKPPPQKKPPPSSQPKQSPQQHQSQKQDQSKSGGDARHEPPKSEPQNQNSKSQTQNSQSSAQNSPPKSSEQKPATAPKPSEQANTGNTQKIGGRPQPPADKNTDPALAMPMQKLDQLRNEDSPAKLFEMLDSRDRKPPPKQGNDW